MTDCRHHWILSQPEADIVLGHCKKCDGDRVFPSRLDDTDRGHDYLEATTGAGMASRRVKRWIKESGGDCSSRSAGAKVAPLHGGVETKKPPVPRAG